MAILTLSQIISRATELAGGRLDWSASDASFYVNRAIEYVAMNAGVQHKPREVLAFASTSTNTATVENRVGLPTDYDYALDIKIGVPNSWSTATSRTTSWTPLDKLPAPWVDSCIAGRNSFASGVPTSYAEFATWLELTPSPNSAYSIQLRYARKLSEISLSASTPALDEQWHWAVVLKTAELLAASRDDDDRAARNRNMYVDFTSGLRLDQTKKRMDMRGMHVTYLRRLR